MKPSLGLFSTLCTWMTDVAPFVLIISCRAVVRIWYLRSKDQGEGVEVFSTMTAAESSDMDIFIDKTKENLGTKERKKTRICY